MATNPSEVELARGDSRLDNVCSRTHHEDASAHCPPQRPQRVNASVLDLAIARTTHPVPTLPQR